MKLVLLSLSLLGALGALIVTPPAPCSQTACAPGYICQFEICIPASLFNCNPTCLGSQYCVPGHKPFCAELFPECTPACGDGSFCTWDNALTGTTKCQPRTCDAPCAVDEWCLMGACTSSCTVCPLLGTFAEQSIDIMANASINIARFVNIMDFDFKNTIAFDGTVAAGVLAQFDKDSTFDLPVVAMTEGIDGAPSALLIGDVSNTFIEILALKTEEAALFIGKGANATIRAIMMDDANVEMFVAADSDFEADPQMEEGIFVVSSISLGSKSTLHINGDMRADIQRVNASYDASINLCGGVAISGEIASGIVTLNSEQGAYPSIFIPTNNVFTVNVSVVGSLESFIEVAGLLELGGVNSLVTVDIDVRAGGQLAITSNTQLTGEVNLDANSAMLIDISNGASAPFFGLLENCPTGSTIYFVVDNVDNGGQRVILTYNSNTQPAGFGCGVVLVDEKGNQRALTSSVQSGPTRRLLASDCVDEATWDGNSLSYTLCGSGSAASATTAPFFVIALLAIISSLASQ